VNEQREASIGNENEGRVPELKEGMNERRERHEKYEEIERGPLGEMRGWERILDLFVREREGVNKDRERGL